MRLIDADELFKKLSPNYNETKQLIEEGETHLNTLAEGYTEVSILINDAPTIETEPVRQGHWEQYDMDIMEHPYHCSKCGWANHHINNRYVGEFKFCPECGSRMDEVQG